MLKFIINLSYHSTKKNVKRAANLADKTQGKIDFLQFFTKNTRKPLAIFSVM